MDRPRLRLLPDSQQHFGALAGRRVTDLAIAHPNLPVIVVSGYSSSENTDLPPDVLFVPKPFSSKMLLACVRQALDDR